MCQVRGTKSKTGSNPLLVESYAPSRQSHRHQETALDGTSFIAYRRVSTSIIVPIGEGSQESTPIDPGDLEAARARQPRLSALNLP